MIGYVKQGTALLCAGLAGYVFGIYFMASAMPVITIGNAPPPAWFTTAEQQSTVAAIGALAAAMAWIYLDYRYGDTA